MSADAKGPAVMAAESRSVSARRRVSARLAALLPLAVVLGVGAALYAGLFLNPREIPSALIGKPVPQFDLPPVQGRTLGLATQDLKGEVSLVNVFASWCTACRYEHPLFMRLQAEGTVPIHGINYKDRPQDAAKWLDELGDPYARTGADRDGRVSIDWGVYGVPETYVVDRNGRIAFKKIGPVDAQTLERETLPLIEELRR